MSQSTGRSGAGKELAASWFVTVVWLGLSAPLVWAMRTDAELRGSPWVLLTALFPLFGLFMLASALRLSLAWMRFGRLELEPDPNPGSVGGHVGGSVALPIRHRQAEDYRVTLSCVRSRMKETSDGRRRSESVVWSDEGVPTVERRGRGVRLRFTFQVPDGLPSTEPESDDHHVWAVRVEGRVPGVDLDRIFDVPVKAGVPPSEARLPALVRDDAGMGRGDRIASTRIHRRGGATVLDYPVGRELGMGVGLTAIGAFFFAFPVGLVWTTVREGLSTDGFGLLVGLFAAPIVLVFALVGGLLTILGLFVLLNGLTVEISAGNLVSRRRVLIPLPARTARVDEVERVEMKIGGQVGSGARARVSYRVVARLVRGGRLVLGDGIRGGPAARALAGVITEATGLEVQEVARGRQRKSRKGLEAGEPPSER